MAATELVGKSDILRCAVMRQNTEITLATLGNDAGIYGGVRMLL